YWKRIKGNVSETLVFDCKFTTYNVLDGLERDNVKFITLRNRYAGLVKETLELPEKEWKRVYVSIPKRKYKNVSVYESEIKLKGCENKKESTHSNSQRSRKIVNPFLCSMA
ncbi:MAG: hypothetical protein NUV86_09320, partial [Candidatus Scalindua sp.]|nr:hypothetical protein [Candidatus Scalindua sp.]MCR4344657.1 hypothetical protein [Candidatus Scalindua sp.]